MLAFYSEILPKRPAYEYIHYRNYFLMSTLIIILLQDLFFNYLKKQDSNKNKIKTISMKQFKSNITEKITGSNYKGLNYIDSVFDESNVNDEVTYFDIEQFSTQGKKSVENNDTGFINQDDFIETKHSKLRKFGNFTQKHKKILKIIFVIILFIQLIYSLVLLFRSVSFSHFKIITPFVQPIAIIIARFLNYYGCKSK
jgi:hypothetical protein